MTVLRNPAAAILLLFVLCLTFGLSYGEERQRPDFNLLEYQSGKTKTFDNIISTKANVMLVTATDCFSCIKELQALDWIRAKYRGDVSVSAVFIDRAGYPRVQRYADYYKFDIDNILIDDGQSVPSRFSAAIVPTMFIFDSKGNQVFRKEGFKDGDETGIITKIDEVVIKPRTTPLPRPEESIGDGYQPPPPKEVDAGVKPARARTSGCASVPG